LILVLGKSFRQESKFFAGTFNALPLLANLDDKAFTAAEVRYERKADLTKSLIPAHSESKPSVASTR